MEREARANAEPLQADLLVDAAHEEVAAPTTMTSQGPFPDVGTERAPAPTASELAFGPDAPAQTNAPPVASDRQPAPVAEPLEQTSQPMAAPPDPERAKHADRAMRAAWNQLAFATPDARSGPDQLRLPANVVKQLDQAWKDSFKDGKLREQGGNLVKTSGPSYELKRQENDSPHMFDGDEKVGWGETLVARVHTHPYDKKDVPEGYASFSEGDFDALMRGNAQMSMLRSGPYTYILSKTKQFNELVDRTNNEEPKLRALAKQMEDTYNAAFNANPKASFPARVEAGVIATAERFHLIYYAGQGSDLQRRSKRPGP